MQISHKNNNNYGILPILDMMKLQTLNISLLIWFLALAITPITWAQELEEDSIHQNHSNTEEESFITHAGLEEQLMTTEQSDNEKKPQEIYYYNLNDLEEHLLLKQINTPPRINVEKIKLHDSLEIPFSIASVGLLVFSLIYYNNKGYVYHLFSAFRNPNLTQRKLKEMIQQDSLINGLFNFMAMCSLGIFTYINLQHWSYLPTHPFLKDHLLIFLILFFLISYTLKVGLNFLIGYVFDIQKEMSVYIFQILLTAKILGILLIPFSIVLYFSEGPYLDILSFASFFLIIVALTMKFLRSGFLFKAFLRFSKFHFILYLCASEILPFLIVLKLFNIF